MSDLQLEGNIVTRSPFYHVTDYLDLLNERIHGIHDFVKTLIGKSILRTQEQVTVHKHVF